MSSSGFGRATVPDGRRGRAGGLALDRDEVARVRGDRSSTRSPRYADDFASGFIAESPDKLRRLPRYYAAARRRRAVSRASRATRRGCRWWSRPNGSVRPCFFHDVDRQRPPDAARHDRHASNLPAFRAVARRRRRSGVRAVRVLDEDVVEERAVASMMAARTRSGRSTASRPATTGRTPRTRCCAHMRARAWRGGGRASCRAARTCSISAAVPGATPSISRERGYRVTAIDWSPAMVDEARRRVAAAGLADRVDVQHARHPRARSARAGAVRRRVLELRPAQLRGRSRRRGAAHRRPAAARRRPGRVGDRPRLPVGDRALPRARRLAARARSASGADPVPVPLEGRTVWTRYYTPAGVRADLRRGRLHARVAARARPVRAAAVSARPSPARHPHLVVGAAARSRIGSAAGRASARGAITF